MGKIYCIIGKSSSGKDTIYQNLLMQEKLKLEKIVLYTTRPIREGEKEGVEYHFVDYSMLKKLEEEKKVIESRCYHTIHGDWYYFMVKDNQINLDQQSYLIIGTVESYVLVRNYFGSHKVIPIYIDLDDGERLARALQRERKQKNPKYEELCRRFLADSKDFAKEKIDEANITKMFYNDDLEQCKKEIIEYITLKEKE